MRIITFLIVVLLFGCKSEKKEIKKQPYILILGSAQDGGYPQAGCLKDCCKIAWEEPKYSQKISSLAIIDPANNKQWVIDATGDFKSQLSLLEQKTSSNNLDGIFLTHAHIGHYLGLAQLGREVMGNKITFVYCMPKMKDFLSNNGPWDQLIKLENIELKNLKNKTTIVLSPNISIRPFLVPHRDEYSETVGFKISTKNKKLIYIPDIDKWNLWDENIVDIIKTVDYALIDGTFYKDGELGRDMSTIPHPFVKESMELFKDLSKLDKNKIFFTHLNHTNPLLQKNSVEQIELRNKGYNFAKDNLIIDL